MKYYIEHENLTRTTTVWEVEAASPTEALKKLDKAEAYNSAVSDQMDDSCNAYFEETNRFVSPPCDGIHTTGLYTLSDYMEE